MRNVAAFFSYGQGSAWIDYLLSGNGTGVLVSKMRAIGVSAAEKPWNWDQANTIAKMVRNVPLDTAVIVGGTSLGANEAPRIAEGVTRTIDLLVGIQPSDWSQTKIAITPNVKRAVFFRNPVWALTGGLGYRQWTLAPGNKTTQLVEVKTLAPHPGDNFPWIHDYILAEVRKLQA